MVSTPGGPLKITTLFDTGSEADAVSFDKAIELKQQLEGVGWGESGGSLVVASGGDVQPAGSLRLLLIAEPGKVSIENLFKIPLDQNKSIRTSLLCPSSRALLKRSSSYRQDLYMEFSKMPGSFALQRL